MARDRLRDRLKAVDPGLTVVPGGSRHRQHRGGKNWDRAAGVKCRLCGRESFRSRDGFCLPCWEGEQDRKVEVRDKTGITRWMPMSIIEQITHPARKDKQPGDGESR